MSAAIPGLSLKTVYYVLEPFVSVGLAARLTEAGAAFGYEERAEPHDHALCRVCGRLYDLAVKQPG